MKIIVGAMECELQKIREIYEKNLGLKETRYLSILEDKVIKQNKDYVCAFSNNFYLNKYYFSIKDKRITQAYKLEEYFEDYFILNSGVGCQNAILSSKILEILNPEETVNIGISGALKPELKKGQIISVNKIYNEFNKEIISLDALDLEGSIKGGEFTSKEFMNSEKKKLFLGNNNIIAVDMESYFFSKSCPFIKVIRIISDEVHEDSKDIIAPITNIIENIYNPKIESIKDALF